MKDHPAETAEMGAKEHGISIEDAKTLMERSHYFDKMTTKDLEDLKVNQKFLRDNGMMRNEVTVEDWFCRLRWNNKLSKELMPC